MPTREEILHEVLQKQTPELSNTEIDESLKSVDKVKRGQTVAVYRYDFDPIGYGQYYLKPPVTGKVTKVWNEDGKQKFRVKSGENEREFLLKSSLTAAIKLVAGKDKFVPPKADSVDSFVRPCKPESYHTVKFEIDQRDADCITVSGTRPGKPTVDELAQLVILDNYRKLQDYDGAWYNVCRYLDTVLERYLHGTFYDCCNRFKVESISITGYDAEKDEFYTIPLPSLEEMGITDLETAYEHYFKQDDDDEEEDSDNDDNDE
jgi:hypothetical protein